jgi:hypothetical protein
MVISATAFAQTPATGGSNGPGTNAVAENSWPILVPLLAAVFGALAGAIAGPIATRLFLKPYEVATTTALAKVQSDLTVERDERTALRDRIDAQENKRFDVLHEQRSRVMAETYSALCDLDDAHDEFSRSFGGYVGGPGPADFWQKFREAGGRYRSAFWPNRILFDAELASALSDLNRAYVAIGNTFGILLRTEIASRQIEKDNAEGRRGAEYDALQSLFLGKPYQDAIQQIEPLQRRIEEAFRRLYGAEH